MARTRDAIEVGVGPSALGFWNKFKRQVEPGTPRLEVEVHPQLSKLRAEIAAERKRQEANAINLKVHLERRSLDRVSSQLKRVEHEWKGSSWNKMIRVQLIVAGASSMPGLIQGLMSLTTAITELGRSTLLLPGIMSSLGAALGTAATGIRGVSDAFKEAGNNTDNAAQKARQYREATRDLERAQRGVVQALKEANRAIEDQRDKLTRNQLSVEQAQLNLQKANQRIAQGGFESVLDWRQALIDQKQAQLDLSDVIKQSKRDIQDYHEEGKRGATQSETYKNAIDRLSASMEEFTRRQTEATGFGEKFIQALQKLSPAAQDFVTKILALKGTWKSLQDSVQQNLFQGLGDAVVDLANKRLPLLRRGMEQVARGLNLSFKQIISTLGSQKNADGISKIFEKTSQALQLMRPGLNSVINAFVQLSEVGTRFLPRLANAFNLVMGRFESFIDRADKDGSLERWIDSGLKTLSQLGNALLGIGSIFGSISDAYVKATGNVGGLVTTIAKKVSEIATKLASPQGQQSMMSFIRTAQEFINNIKPYLDGIGKIFQAIGDGARYFAEIAFPFFSLIGNLLERHAWLVEKVFTLWAGFRTLAPFKNFAAKNIEKINTGMARYRESLREASVEAQRLAKIEADAYQESQSRRDKAVALRDEVKQREKISALAAKTAYAETANAREVTATARARQAQASRNSELGREGVDAAKRRLDLQSSELSSAGFVIDPRTGQRIAQPSLSPEQVRAEIARSRRDAGRRVNELVKDRANLRVSRNEITRELNKIAPDIESRVGPRGGLPADVRRKLPIPPGRSDSKERARVRDLLNQLRQIDRATFTNADELAQQRANVKAYRGARPDFERDRAFEDVSDAQKRSIKLNEEAAQASNELNQAEIKQSNTNKTLNDLRAENVAAQKGLADANKLVAESEDDLQKSHKRSIETQNAAAAATDKYEKRKSIWRRTAKGTSTALAENVSQTQRLTQNLTPLSTSTANVSRATGTLTTAVGTANTATGRFSTTISNTWARVSKLGDAIGWNANNGRGMVARVGGLVAALGTLARTAGSFVAGAGILWALDLLAQAHQKAADAANNQKIAEEALANSLDSTTGAVTTATTSQSIAAAREFKVTGRNNNQITANVPKNAGVLGIDPQLLRLSLDPRQIAAIAKVQEIADANTLAAINRGEDEQWNRHKEGLEENGVTAEIYAKALNGDQESVAKFNNAADALWRDRTYGPGRNFVDNASLRMLGKFGRAVAEDTGQIPNLGVGAQNLVANVPGVSVGQYQRRELNTAVTRGEETKSLNADAKLKSGNPFGNVENPNWGPDGTSVSFDVNLGTDAAGLKRKADLEALGVFLIPRDAPGDYVAQITGSLVDQWVMPRGMAHGGPVWGAGTANSDSIPAMLSNGEFVINATSARAIGHDTLSKLNAIRGFDEGGLVGQEPWQEQAKKALDAAGYTQTGGKMPTGPNRSGYGPFIGEGGTGREPRQNLPRTTAGSNSPGLIGPAVTDFSVPRPEPFTSVVPDAITAIAADSYSGKIPVLNQPKPLSNQQVGGGKQLGPDGPASLPGVTPDPRTQASAEHGPGKPPGPTSTTSQPGVIPTYEQLPGANQGPYPTPAPLTGPALTNPALTPDPRVSGPAPVVPVVSPSGLPMTAPIVQQVMEFAKFADQQGYSWGGFSPTGMDCTGLVLAFANIANGKQPFEGGRVGIGPEGAQGFFTGNLGSELAARGFSASPPPGGTPFMAVGWDGAHAGITLPDGSHIDAQNQANGIVLSQPGGGSPGATGFPNVMYRALDGSMPVIPNFSQAVPGSPGVPGSISSDVQVPGINAPIQGPFGPIPFEPMSILQKIGEAFITAILGFFGIDASPIIGLINNIFGGIPEKGDTADTAAAMTPEDVNPDPNIAPGPDKKIIDDLVSQANQAKSEGNEQLARNLLERAREYESQALRASAPPSTLGSLTMESQPGDVAKAILSEARSRGYSKEQAQAILATAIQESGGLNPMAISPNGLWKGIFQQDASYAGRSDPNQNISAFFDGLDQRGGTSSPDIWKSIMWLQQRPSDPSAEEAYRLGRKEYLSEIQNPNNLTAAQNFMQQFGYARGGLVEKASGGYIRGPGTETSDSIPAMLSDGEFVMRAAAVKHWGVGRLSAMNSIRAYAPGGPVTKDPMIPPPPPPPPGPPPPAPPPPPGTPAPANPGMAGTPTPPAPTDLSQIPYLGKEMTENAAGIAGSLLAPKKASSGGSPGAPQPRSIDPRATLAPAPTSSQHIHPALSAAISAPIGMIGSAVGQAAGAAASTGTALALAGGTMGGGAALAPMLAPMAGQAASQFAQFGTQMANDVAVGAANILSSLLVGTVTPPQTGQGYGAPLLPQSPQPVTNFQSIHNGNVVTNDLTEYNRLRDRKDAQRAAPFFNRVGP